MEIRYLSPEDDLKEIGRIYEQSWKYAYKNIIPQSYLDSISSDGWADGINRDSRTNLVMMESGIMVGTSCICRSRWESHADYGEIVSLYFLPEYIVKGYGGKLLDRAVEELERRGFEKILLWVLEDNGRARRFYEKHGFVCSKKCKDERLGGKKLREVMYEYRDKGTANEKYDSRRHI